MLDSGAINEADGRLLDAQGRLIEGNSVHIPLYNDDLAYSLGFSQLF